MHVCWFTTFTYCRELVFDRQLFFTMKLAVFLFFVADSEVEFCVGVSWFDVFVDDVL